MSGANGAISAPRTKPIASELVKIGWIHYALNRDPTFPSILRYELSCVHLCSRDLGRGEFRDSI